MIKQVILDMQNQLMQVKTQVALAIADQHILERKCKENREREADWMRKAEMAVTKKQDDLARAALDRALSCQQMAAGFEQQVTDQKTEVENLRQALHKLDQKLAEAEAKSDLLIAQHRRARALSRASDARAAAGGRGNAATFDRMKRKVQSAEALSHAKSELLGDNIDDRLAALDKEDQIEKLLGELKARQ
jgi:phage shock protein A